jgi:TonB family protein
MKPAEALSFRMQNVRRVMLCNLAAVCGLAFSITATAQGAANGPAQTDAKTLSLAAAAINNLDGGDAKPWHIKISYTLTTPDGKPATQGTFEEFWTAPSKYKRTFSSAAFNQVEYGTADGPRRTRTPDSPPSDLQAVVDEFLRPIPLDPTTVGAAKLQAQSLMLGSTKLLCITAALAGSAMQLASSTSYCVDENPPVLRLTVTNGGVTKTTRDGIVRFQDRYVAQKVERYTTPPPMPGPKPPVPPPPPTPELTAKVETLELIGSVDDAMFTPPAGAVAPPKVIALDEKTTRKQLLQHPMAEYPPMAHWQKVYGVVVVALRVQTDGHVSNLRVVSGHPLLKQAALDAISKWTYKPFVVDGQLVEVDTTASTTFNLMP